MFILRSLWKAVLFLGIVSVLTQGAAPARGDGGDGLEKSVAHGSDSRQFLGELRSGGALKFYEDTEDILRTGKFERAYTRYCFLRAHIQGLHLDRGLVPMVDQRLSFLKEQMHLGEGVHCYVPEEKPVARKKHAKPVCPPPPPKCQEPTEEKAPEIIIPPVVPETKGGEPPKPEAIPPGEETPKPAPAPSFWEKFKSKLKFW